MADTSFEPSVPDPAYPIGTGPLVMVDEAHFNFHTIDGRFAPFAELLRRDGFVVTSVREGFKRSSLERGHILVIAGALSKRSRDDWSLPTPSAFSGREIAAVRDWVREGGSLLLIADHMPFAGAAADFAAVFGVHFNNGFAFDTRPNKQAYMFRSSDGSLADHPITSGRTDAERVDSLAGGVGSAFRSASDAQPLLLLGSGVTSVMPTVAWHFTPETPRISANGWSQGAVLHFGKGRVAVFGEASMFTAQFLGPDRHPMGMNTARAVQNPQFLLNLFRWLSGLRLAE